jgi:hypothetical protein
MKDYKVTVQVTFTAYTTLIVEAESAKESILLAKDEARNMSSYEFDDLEIEKVDILNTEEAE